jgi:hypothetical protein
METISVNEAEQMVIFVKIMVCSLASKMRNDHLLKKRRGCGQSSMMRESISNIFEPIFYYLRSLQHSWAVYRVDTESFSDFSEPDLFPVKVIPVLN